MKNIAKITVEIHVPTTMKVGTIVERDPVLEFLRSKFGPWSEYIHTISGVSAGSGNET